MRPTYSMNVPPSLFALEASIPDPKDKALKVEETSTPSSMITVRGRWRRTSHDVYTCEEQPLPASSSLENPWENTVASSEPVTFGAPSYFAVLAEDQGEDDKEAEDGSEDTISSAVASTVESTRTMEEIKDMDGSQLLEYMQRTFNSWFTPPATPTEVSIASKDESNDTSNSTTQEEIKAESDVDLEEEQEMAVEPETIDRVLDFLHASDLGAHIEDFGEPSV